MAAHPKAAKKAAILSRDGCARIVDVRNLVHAFYIPFKINLCWTAHLVGDMIYNANVELSNRANRIQPLPGIELRSQLTRICFSACGSLLFAGSESGSIVCWSTVTNKKGNVSRKRILKSYTFCSHMREIKLTGWLRVSFSRPVDRIDQPNWLILRFSWSA